MAKKPPFCSDINVPSSKFSRTLSILRAFPTVALGGRWKIDDLSPAGCWDEHIITWGGKADVDKVTLLWEHGNTACWLWGRCFGATLSFSFARSLRSNLVFDLFIFLLLRILLVIAACFALGHQGSHTKHLLMDNSREAGGTRTHLAQPGLSPFGGHVSAGWGHGDIGVVFHPLFLQLLTLLQHSPWGIRLWAQCT